MRTGVKRSGSVFMGSGLAAGPHRASAMGTRFARAPE
jgi:hypothetical protein